MSQQIDVHKVFADFFDDQISKTAAYAVSKKLAEGHTCINIEKYNNAIRENALNTEDNIQESNREIDMNGLLKSKWVTNNLENIQPFVLSDGNLYLHRYYSYETEIIEQIRRFIESENQCSGERTNLLKKHTEFINQLFTNHTVNEQLSTAENINWQLVAAITSLLKNFSIITGGPGTGKTTTVAKILAVLFTLNPKLKVALAAPTGKAAARMKESLLGAKDSLTGLSTELKKNFGEMEASTIHRLLGYLKNSPYFKYNSDNLLNYDVVIVDESSMIGASLMAKLLTAVKPSARIILLGDKDQLASVEAGSIFGDICLTQYHVMNTISQGYANWVNGFIDNNESQVKGAFVSDEVPQNILQEHIIELKTSHRFKSYEGIGKFSKAVISGKLSEELLSEAVPTNSEYVQLCSDYNAPELKQLMRHYFEYIQEKDIAQALKKINKVRFLCAIRSGEYGVDHYNQLIEQFLEKEKLIKPNDQIYEHQPIMITQNDYNLGLFNGDIGIIRKDEQGQLKAWFEDAEQGIKSIHTGYLSAFNTVFAMTIHKSQGSEFDHVAIVLPNDDNSPILTRELIYTAITRAKKSAVIFSPKEVLIHGIERQVERASGITERLLNYKTN